MEYWSRRSRLMTRLLLSVSLLFAAGVMALLTWLLLSVIAGESDKESYIFLVILLLPVPYLLIYLLGRRRGPSFPAKRKLKKRLRESPPASARAGAVQVWDCLPFKRSSSAGELTASLAASDDEGWPRLDEANRDVRLATGVSFDFPVLLKDGALNFVSGELPGIGTWVCVPGKLIEGLGHEELMASIIHEIWHAEAGELETKRIALALYDFGLFASAFLIYYLSFAIIVNSLPLQFSVPQLPWFALLVLVFWSAVKIFSLWAVCGLFPQGSRLAADDYAARVLADPLVVAGAISKALDYSAGNAAVKSLLSGRTYYTISRFMFSPLLRGRNGRKSTLERLDSLRLEPSPLDAELLPQVEAMNLEIAAISGEVRETYDKLLGGAPSRLVSVFIYAFIVCLVLGFLAFATGRNFLPVRWFLDTFSGSPNAAVDHGSDSAATVYIIDIGSAASGMGCSFRPLSVEVRVGETVTWVNQDDEDHVISGEGIPTSPLLRPGEGYTVVFNRSGRCEFHIEDGGEDQTLEEGEVFVYY
ncbi:MAG: hypothetical protein AB1384_11340 [Actinomycetota bacterium]